jgi:homoserine kinase
LAAEVAVLKEVAGAELRSEAAKREAVFKTAQSELLVLGLARGDLSLVARGLADRVHQPYRAHLYPRSMELVAAAPSLGALGATISGAGAAVLVWTSVEQTGAVLGALREWVGEWACVQRAAFEPAGADVREV